MAAIRTCFLSTLEPHSVGDALEGDPDNPCVFATLSATTVLTLFGFGSAIYKTRGRPCEHSYASHNWRPNVITPHGGYREWDFPPGHLGIRVFDKLEVVDVIRERLFGPNGGQVITALEWFRSLFVAREGDEQLQIRLSFGQRMKRCGGITMTVFWTQAFTSAYCFRTRTGKNCAGAPVHALGGAHG